MFWIEGVPANPDLIEVPGQERRADGSVWSDGLFNDPGVKQVFCGDHPDAWFCSEIGSAGQAWTSVEYYGLAKDVGDSCYGPTTINNGDCVFPAKRKFRLIVQTTGCFVGQAPPLGPSTLQEQAMLDGVRNAAMEWDSNGGIDVCISGVAGCGGSDYIDVVIDCNFQGDPDDYAAGGLTGLLSKKVNNAPVGPDSGQDTDDFYTLPGGVIGVNVPNVWDGVRSCYPNPTIGNIKSWMRFVGAHEFGHVAGFGHFDTPGLIMYPFRPPACSPPVFIGSALDDALQSYDPNSSGVTLLPGQLWAQDPL
jgi:hypothetical protein